MLLYLLPAISAALSAFTYKHIWIDSQNVPHILTSCKHVYDVAALNLSSLDTVSKELVCIRSSFLQQLFSDRSGVGSLLVLGSILLPLFIKLGYHAGSPNNASFLQGPILPILALTLTSLDLLVLGRGWAVFTPTLISLAYALGSAKSKISFALPRVPCPAPAIYASNIVAVIMSVFLVATMLYDVHITESAYWWEPYVPVQITSVFRPSREVIGDAIPLFAIPIVWLGYRDVRRITSEDEAKRQLGDLLAEEVAYGFERTWAYFRQIGLLSFAAYVWGMSRIYRGVITDGKVPSVPAQYVLLISALLSLTLLTTVVTDNTIASEHDDKEALTAIARAPAGNAGVENNAKVLLPLAIVAGPSLSALLWFAHVEEIRGYKGRRSWRAFSAAEKEQQVAAKK